MVMNGFSLLELRKLYIDELYIYYEEMFYTLEMQGKVKDGTYGKIKSMSNSEKVDDTVNNLRRQMFKSIADKNNLNKKNGR